MTSFVSLALWLRIVSAPMGSFRSARSNFPSSVRGPPGLNDHNPPARRSPPVRPRHPTFIKTRRRDGRGGRSVDSEEGVEAWGEL